MVQLIGISHNAKNMGFIPVISPGGGVSGTTGQTSQTGQISQSGQAGHGWVKRFGK